MNRRFLLIVGGLGVAAWFAAWSGCSAGRQAAMELDKVAKSLDSCGFASISAPFLASPVPQFKFDLDKPASFYFDRALTSVQGGVRASDAQAVDTQVAIRINVEQALATLAQFQQSRSIAEFRENQRKVKLQKQMLESTINAVTPSPELTSAAAANPKDNPMVKATLGMLDVAANAPEPSPEALPGFKPDTTAPPDKPPFSVTDRLALASVGQGFTANRPFPDEHFAISAREALMIASGDHLTQALLKWFQYPAGNRLGDYELFFCPLVVSVKPGHDTRKGYQADVTVTVDLARTRNGNNGGALEFLSEKFPDASPPIQVAGVFPLIDNQVLDLVSSRRRLYSLAFQLAAVGFGSQANVFLDYARKLEQDAQTRTALTVASAYTIGATSFGFRVEPQYLALENPAALEATPGDVLQSRTFPAMAMVLVHRSYLHHRRDDVLDQPDDQGGCNGPKNGNGQGFGRWRDQFNGGGSPADVIYAHRHPCDSSDQGAAVERYDYLVLRTGVRWSPVHTPWIAPLSRVSEVDMWSRAKALDKAAHWVDPDHGKSHLWSRIGAQFDPMYLGMVPGDFQRAHLASRILTLRQMALDTQALIRIDQREPDCSIRVDRVVPEHGWIDQPTVLTFYGSGFEGNVESVTVGGRKCTYQTIRDNCMLATVPAWNTKSDGRMTENPLSPPPVPSAFAQIDFSNLPTDAQISLFRELRAEFEARDDSGSDAAGQKPSAAETESIIGEVVIGAHVKVFKRSSTSPSRYEESSNVGTITFDRKTPKPDAAAAARPSNKVDSTVRIKRDPTTGSTEISASGNYSEALELLKQYANVAKDPCAGGNVQFQIEGSLKGGTSCKPTKRAPTTQPATPKAD